MLACQKRRDTLWKTALPYYMKNKTPVLLRMVLEECLSFQDLIELQIPK